MKKHLFYAFAMMAVIGWSCSDDKDPTPDPDPDPEIPPVEEIVPHFSGNDVFGEGQVQIIRDKETKKASVVVDLKGEWEVYAGSTVETIDFKNVLLKGTEADTFDLSVSNTGRSYFQFISKEGDAILSERRLPMTGGDNFRDLGGFKTKSGKYVKWGKVFRSDELAANLTDEDRDYLSSIPLTSIVDFRENDEREKTPDISPASVKNVYDLPLDPGNLASMDVREILGSTEGRLDSIMYDVNKDLVSDPVSQETYKEFFRLLQDEQNIPLIFHCSAGKDRTGMGAYLFLSSLGVDEEIIIEDYLYSNECLKDKYRKLYGPAFDLYPHLKVLAGVKREYLQTAIDIIVEEHGSVENYLTNILNVDLGKMRSMYLY